MGIERSIAAHIVTTLREQPALHTAWLSMPEGNQVALFDAWCKAVATALETIPASPVSKVRAVCGRCAELREQMAVSAQLDKCDAQGNYNRGFAAGSRGLTEASWLLRMIELSGATLPGPLADELAKWVTAERDRRKVLDAPDFEATEKV